MRERAARLTPRHREPGAASLAFATCLLAAATATAADELPSVSAYIPWELSERNEDPENGFVLYKRPQANSNFDAYRLEAVIDAPPAAVAEAARRNIVDPELVHDNMQKQVLRTEGNVAWVYSYIDLPMMVSDRDVITRSERSYDPATGVYRLDWRASKSEGPAPKRGVVRLEYSNGSWVFSPNGHGDTRAVYENFTDIGGSIPAWIVKPMMNSTVMRSITDLRQTVEEDQQRSETAAASAALGQLGDALLSNSPDPL